MKHTVKKLIPLKCNKLIDKLLKGVLTKRKIESQERELVKQKIELMERQLLSTKQQFDIAKQELDVSMQELVKYKQKFDGMENALFVKKEPDFIIVGAQKAGTSSLFDYLNKLDGFKGSNIKEIHYFSIDDRFKKNKDWYLSHFSSDTNQRTFEATPFYLYHPESPSRIFNSIKTSKFIVLLRNPAERAYSHWNMFRSSHRDIDKKKRFLDQAIKGSYFYNLMMEAKFPSFKDSINEDLLKYHEKISDINPGYVRRGLYYEQLQNYLKYYNIKNFLFVDFEDLTNNIPKVLKQVLDFLDIGEHEGEKLLANLNMAEINISNKGKYESQCEDDKETLEYLREFYKPHNEKLFNLIGKRFDW